MQQEMKLRRRIAGGAVAAVLTCGLMIPQAAFAEPDSASKQAEAQAVLASLNSMQMELDQASANYGEALAEQEAAQQSADEAQTRIDEINVEIADVQSRLGDRAHSMYRSGAASFLDLLLGSTSFSEFATNWDLLNKVNNNDAELVQKNKDLRDEAQQQKDTFGEQTRIAAQKANEAKQLQDEAQSTVNSMQATYDSLSAEVAELVAQEKAAQEAAAAAQAQQTVEQSANQAASNDNGGSNDGGNQGGGNDGGYQGGGGNDGGGSTIVYPGGDGSAGDNSAAYSYACSRIGCPYVWGAEGPDSFDCSGLVTWAYRQLGIELPHQSEAQMARATRVVSVSEARPGDVLWRYGHVGIAGGYGGTPYVHAPTFGACVRNTDSLSWSNFTNALQF